MAKTSAVRYADLPIEELTALIENAVSQLQLNNIDAMTTALSAAIAQATHNSLWANALLCRAKIHVLLYGDKSMGLEDLLAAHYYFIQVQDEKKQCETGVSIGFCYLWAGLVELAVEQLRATYILAKRNNVAEVLARTFKLLADAHGIMGDYESAAAYSQEALEIAQHHGFFKTLMASLYALIQAYNHLNKSSEAMPLADMALEYALQRQDVMNTELAYNMKSLVYHRLGEYNKAVFWIRKSEQILNKLPPTTQRRWQTQLQKSVYLCDAGRIPQALAIAKTILYDSPIQHDAPFLIEVHGHLAHIYSLMKDKTRATQHSKMKSELQLQYSGKELQQRVKVVMVTLHTERFQLEAQLERERAQHLEKELASREKELTVLALHLAQKNEMLRGIEQKLQALEKTLSRARKSIQVSMKSVVNEVKSDINASQHADRSWQIFEQQFSAIHPEFVRQLSNLHPDLTSMELRLCALMKVSLSTKEIANILCINAGSVDVYRFRIRKKMGMKRGDNLSAYLAGI